MADHKSNSIFEAAKAVLSRGDLAEGKQSFKDLKKPVQDSLLKIFQMYDNTSLTREQKDGLKSTYLSIHQILQLNH